MVKGKFYFLFVLLGEDVWYMVLEYVVVFIYELDVFVVECVKMVCYFFKVIVFLKVFDDCLFFELNKCIILEEIFIFLVFVL